MASPSPAPSNNGSPAAPLSLAAAMAAGNSNGKSLRGLNKPKCIKCGNVARSRCPFQSCKSCCAKAQNPCHIHVLKVNGSYPEKTPTTVSTSSDQQITEPSPSGTTHRIASLRQLSNSFAQFNNLQSPLRARRPLTRKEAAVINEWRFKKLKEYKEGIIETENEAFDRYMQNISLLEEVLAVNPKTEGTGSFGTPKCDIDPTSAENNKELGLLGLKLKLRSKPSRSENSRKRVQAAVDRGLKKLRKIDLDHGESDPNKGNGLMSKDENIKFWAAERESSMNDLLDRLNKARNEEDLRSCLEIKSNIFGKHRDMSSILNDSAEVISTEVEENDLPLIQLQSDYSAPKWMSTDNVDQDVLNRIDSRFSSPEGIESL